MQAGPLLGFTSFHLHGMQRREKSGDCDILLIEDADS